jgi:hypothetical protein
MPQTACRHQVDTCSRQYPLRNHAVPPARRRRLKPWGTGPGAVRLYANRSRPIWHFGRVQPLGRRTQVRAGACCGDSKCALTSRAAAAIVLTASVMVCAARLCIRVIACTIALALILAVDEDPCSRYYYGLDWRSFDSLIHHPSLAASSQTYPCSRHLWPAAASRLYYCWA